jgi:hypothetical protein
MELDIWDSDDEDLELRKASGGKLMKIIVIGS